MGMVKALKLDGDAADVLQELFNSTKNELKLHKAYANEWGVDLDMCQPTPCTLEYTTFLLNTARSEKVCCNYRHILLMIEMNKVRNIDCKALVCRWQGVAEIVASMLPCSRLYGYLGCELAKRSPDSSNPYIEWIRTYSSEEYLVKAIR